MRVNVLVVEDPKTKEIDVRVYGEDQREDVLDEFARLTRYHPRVWVSIHAVTIGEHRPWQFEDKPLQEVLGV